MDLPPSLAPFFWDTDFAALSWQAYPDFIIRRVLQVGDWAALTWLRAKIGDEGLRQWLVQHAGRGLSPRQLRFWGVVLEIDRRRVNRWVTKAKASVWERRLQS